MSPKKNDSTENILRDRTGDIATMRAMGITDFAIITYLVRVKEGMSKANALRGLLSGRSLKAGQVEFVRTVLEGFPIPSE